MLCLTHVRSGSNRGAEVEMPYRPNYLPDHEDSSFRPFCLGSSGLSMPFSLLCVCSLGLKVVP